METKSLTMKVNAIVARHKKKMPRYQRRKQKKENFKNFIMKLFKIDQ